MTLLDPAADLMQRVVQHLEAQAEYTPSERNRESLRALLVELRLTNMTRFEHTYCSQCGKDLGPGDEGVSSCCDHGACRAIARGDSCNCDRKRPPIPAARVEPIPGGVADLPGWKPSALPITDDQLKTAMANATAARAYAVGADPWAAISPAGVEWCREFARAVLNVAAVSLPSSTPGLDPRELGVNAADLDAGKAALAARAYGPVLKNLATPEPFHPQFVSGYWHGHADGRERGKRAAGSGLDPIRSSDGEELEPVRKPQDPYGY